MRFADCNITEITPSGEVTIKTSEPVVVRDDWQTEELGLDILDVEFIENSDGDGDGDAKRNNLLGFEIISFEPTEVKVQLNFTSPLLVSQGEYAD